MNLSRKDFFRKGVLTLGQAVLNPAALLEGGPEPPAPSLRPPGFAEEQGELCGACDLCVSACPEGCLERQKGVAGPVFVPRLGGCTWCTACRDVCPHGVITTPEDGERLGLAVADNGRCIAHRGGCFTCEERCPADAITIDFGSGLVIDRARCTGCGACEYACPIETSAIRVNPLSPP